MSLARTRRSNSTENAAQTRFRATFTSLRERNYRLYCFGQAISQPGTWMQTVAQAWLVLKLTGSGTSLGFVIALQYLPVLFLGPWGGVLVDRMDKRRVLLVTQSAAGTFAFLLGVLVQTGTVRLWMVYVLAAGLGGVNMVDSPARQTFVTEMVGGPQLENAVALNTILINAARVVGPALAAAMIALVGLGPCFLFNGASFMGVVVGLLLMRTDELQRGARTTRAKGQVRQGLRYVAARPALRDTLIMLTITGTFASAFPVSLPLLARFTFHGGSSTYAWMTAAMGGGAVVSGLLLAGRRPWPRRMLTWLSAAYAACMLLAAVAPTLPIAYLAMALVGASSLAFTVLANSTLQRGSEPSMRGRVMALWAVALLGTTPIGGPIVGFVGDRAGPRWCLVLGGMACLLASGVGARSTARDSSPDTVLDPADPVLALLGSAIAMPPDPSLVPPPYSPEPLVAPRP
jgi:MFS family permease